MGGIGRSLGRRPPAEAGITRLSHPQDAVTLHIPPTKNGDASFTLIVKSRKRTLRRGSKMTCGTRTGPSTDFRYGRTAP
jgi:hypothetical protein